MTEIKFLGDDGCATQEGMLEFLSRLDRPGVAQGVVDELDVDEWDDIDDDADERALEILARTTGLDQHTTQRIITMLSFTASVAGDALDFVTHNLDRDHGDEWDEYNLKGMARSVGFSLGEPEPA